MAAPQVTLYTGVIPVRTQTQTAFSTNTSDLLTWWPTSVPEMNAVSDYVNTQATATESAANIAQTAITSANFKGTWSGLTGAANIPYTTYHSGTYWQLLNNIGDVTASEPGVTGDWALSAQSAGRVVIQSPLTLTITGRYYILGSAAITVPDPATLSAGNVFDFSKQPAETPTIVAPTNKITSKFGLDDTIIMDLGNVEIVVNNSLYEV